MSDFLNCMAQAVANGEVEQDMFDHAKETFEEAHSSASETLGPAEAERIASQAVIDDLTIRKMEVKRQRVLVVKTRRQLLADLHKFKEARGYKNISSIGGGGGRPPKSWDQGGSPPKDGAHKGIGARFLELLVENKPGLSGAPTASLEGRYRVLRGKADAMMADIIEKFETKFGYDTPGRADLDDVVRAAFGEEVENPVSKALAGAWRETAENFRLMYNAAGGAIGKLDDWGLPQHHDPVAMREMGKEKWVEYIAPKLNRARMIDKFTKVAFTERRLKAVLGDVFDTIASSGATKRKAGAPLGKGKLADQRNDHRFLIFKDADAWLSYQRDFGMGDPYQVMMGHLDDMARDISSLQILGPNPEAQWKWLKNFAAREADLEELKGVKGAKKQASAYLHTAQNMMDHYTGDASLPVNEDYAKIGSSARAILTGIDMGSAIISDMPSAPIFGLIGRAWSGLNRTGDLTALMKHIVSPEQRSISRRSGFIIEQATDGFARATQDNMRLMTVGNSVNGHVNVFARRLPVFVLRASGMTGWDAARKRSFRLEFMGKLHDVRDLSLKDLANGDAEDRTFAELLRARGFSEQDWGVIKKAPVWEPEDGVKLLRPMDIADPELALRVGEMIEMQSRMAVPQTSIWTRAKLLQGSRPGTILGEATRSFMMFRSFTVTASNLFIEEVALRSVRSGNALGYQAAFAASFVTALTIAGAIAIQMREVAKGNTPRDMFDENGTPSPKFWWAAMTQGGGLGILGDFAYAANARSGKSSTMTSLGPVAAAGSDMWNATAGNVGEVVSGIGEGKEIGDAVSDAHVGRDVSNIVRNYSPMSSLWWGRAVWNRAVADQIQKLLDPDAQEAFDARARTMERETGSEQWWASGDAIPEGAH